MLRETTEDRKQTRCRNTMLKKCTPHGLRCSGHTFSAIRRLRTDPLRPPNTPRNSTSCRAHRPICVHENRGRASRRLPLQENSTAQAARATQARKRNVPAGRSNQRPARSPPPSRGASATCPKLRAPWDGKQRGPRPRACVQRAARRRPRSTPAQRRWMRGGRWRARRPQLSGPGQTWWQRPSPQRQ